MGFSVILRQIWWSRMSKVFFAWGNNRVCFISISCSSWLTVRFSAFQCFQIQWSVGLLVLSRVQGAKELELVAVFIWAAEHLRAHVENQQWIGTEPEDIRKDPSLSLLTTFSHFSESAFFSWRPDTFFILVNMGWICSQPNFFNIQSGEILHRLFKSVRILHIGQNCKVEAEFNSPNMKSDWVNVQKWMILWVTIPFSDQFFSTLLPENIFGPPVRPISVSFV